MGTFVCPLGSGLSQSSPRDARCPPAFPSVAGPVCSLPGSLYDEEYIRLPDTRRYIHPKCWRCHECQQPLHQWRKTTTNHFVC